MANLEKLNELIESSDYPVKVIARKAGMTTQSLYNKRMGYRELTVKEILALSEVFGLSRKQREEIFLI